MCYDSIKHMPKNKYGNGIFRRRIIIMSNKSDGTNENTMTDEELESISGLDREYKGHGMPCPKCKRFIHMDITEHLKRRIIDCPHCRLRINVDYKK